MSGGARPGPLGAFTTADMDAMGSWITGSPTTPTPPSSHDSATPDHRVVLQSKVDITAHGYVAAKY